MDIFERMLLSNQDWAEEKISSDPQFFERLSKTQTPEVLWIGCSDSRVPAEIVVHADPGEMFVHRNIANQIHHGDGNCLSVLQYAIDVLKVKHVVVCGHYNCGGVRAAMDTKSPALNMVNNWLQNVTDLYKNNDQDFLSLGSDQLRFNYLVELNVKDQIISLEKLPVIQDAWSRGQRLALHGCVYAIQNGLIKELIKRSPNDL